MAPYGDCNLSSPLSNDISSFEPETAAAATTPSPSSSSMSPAISALKSSTSEEAIVYSSHIGGGGSTSSNETVADKPAWSKPSNIAVEIGLVSWPTLSQSARPDSSKALSEESVSFSQKFTSTNTNPNLNSNHGFPVRQKSMKPTSVAFPDSSPRDLPHNNNNWETGSKEPLVPQSHNGNSHPSNSFRRGNGGGSPHPRSGSSDYMNRRYHHRPNNEWNSHRNFSGREGHMQQQRFMPRNFYRPPLPTSPHFVSPHSPIRPFVNPGGYPDMNYPYFLVPPLPRPPPESFRGGQYIAHAPPPMMYYPQQDHQLLSMLLKQIEYYFSSDNLIKDIYLRQYMNEHGWVPISVIADFPRVKKLTRDVQSILTAVETSTVVEVQGGKIRRRNDWINWLLPPPNHFPVVSNPRSSGTSTLDPLVAHMQSFGLEGSTGGNNTRGTLEESKISSRSSSGESNNQ